MLGEASKCPGFGHVPLGACKATDLSHVLLCSFDISYFLHFLADLAASARLAMAIIFLLQTLAVIWILDV